MTIRTRLFFAFCAFFSLAQSQENFGYIYKAFPDSYDEYLSYCAVAGVSRTEIVQFENEVISSSSEAREVTRIGDITINVPLDFSRHIEVNPNVDVEIQKNEERKEDEISYPHEKKNGHQINSVENIVYVSNNIVQNEEELNYLESKKCRNDLAKWILIFFGLVLFVVFVVKKTNRGLLNKMKKNTEKQTKETLKFESLGPVFCEGCSETLEMLKYSVLEEKNIKNVAISGPYGSGKSSVWKTFERDCKSDLDKLNLVKISLAKFNPPQADSKKKVSPQEIEESFIQQLIYSQKATTLKYSRFFRIKNLSGMKALLIAMAMIACVSTALLLISPAFVEKVCAALLVELSSIHVLFAFAAIALLWIVFKLVQTSNKCNVSGICVKDLKIELKEDQHLINQYLDEIVYFFEATKCKCLLIEDLDRFDSFDIFAKIREINVLVNNHPEICKSGTVKFVYAVQDGLLKGGEKTKFFDFVIPVIPVATKDNAADFAKKTIGSKSFSLDEEYLRNVRDYLVDVRVVKSCLNEAAVYKSELNRYYSAVLASKFTETKNEIEQKSEKITLINEKLFSILLYKNLCPKDFHELSKGKGFLHKCLYSLDDLVADYGDVDWDVSKADAKTLLNGPDADKCRTCINRYVDEEKKNQYIDADANLIQILLSNGYVDESYSMYINKSYESLFSDDEKVYLFNVNMDFPNSKELTLIHYKELEREIAGFRWNSPGVLHEGMIDYLLEKYSELDAKETVIPKIVRVMWSYYKMTNENFIKLFMEKCLKEQKKKELLYGSICVVKNEFTEKERNEFLKSIFDFGNFDVFLDFLRETESKEEKANVDIERFLDENVDFKDRLFVEYGKNVEPLIDTFERANVKISLTEIVAHVLKENKRLNTDIYRLDRDNIDRILSVSQMDKSDVEPGYVSRCLSIEGLNRRISKEMDVFCGEVINGFGKIVESYETVKLILSSNIDDTKKMDLFNKMPSSWENCVLFGRYVSTNLVLDPAVVQCLNIHSMDQEEKIVEIIRNDPQSVECFVACVVAKSRIEDVRIENEFIPIWERHISILSCFSNYVLFIKIMDTSRIRLMIKYAVTKELDNLTNVAFLNMVVLEPDFFESVYPEEEYAKDTPFKKLILGKKEKALIGIKRHFLKKTDMYPLDDVQGKTLYREAAKECTPEIVKDDNSYLIESLNKVREAMKKIENIDLFGFDSDAATDILNLSDTLDFDHSEFEDCWTKMLWNVFKYRLHQLTMFLCLNTKPYGVRFQALLEGIRHNQTKVDEMNARFRQMYVRLKEDLNETLEYIESKR